MKVTSEHMLKAKYAVHAVDEIETVIRQAKICRLGLVDRGSAYIVPLNFGYEAGILYFHTGPKGRKIDLIRENPEVSFEIDTEIRVKTGQAACDWNMIYQSVMGQGRAQFVETREQKRHALKLIMQQYSEGSWSFPDEKLDKTTILTVQIESISARSNMKGES